MLDRELPHSSRKRARFLRAALTALFITACSPGSGSPVIDVKFAEIDNSRNLPVGTVDSGIRARMGREIYTTQIRFSQEIDRSDKDPRVCLVRFITPDGNVGNYRSYDNKPFCQKFDFKPYLVPR